MRIKTHLFPAIILWVAITGLAAQDLAEAKRLAESGQHLEAEKIYNAFLATNPDHLEALIGAGYNLSWAKRREAAREKFELALALDPTNEAALVGKGYNLAWGKQYAAAKYSFQTLEKSNPGSSEARKGLAYVALWEGNGVLAIQHFEYLVLANSKELAYYIALAQAYLLENRIRKARIALKSALLLDSTNQTVTKLLQNTNGIAAPIELDVWTGYSKTGGMDNFNLRTVQLSAQLAKKLRMYLKYDNSLSMDLASLVRSNQEAQAFSIGAVVPLSQQFISRLEYGTRFLPDNVIQQVISTEHVYFLSDKISLKAGGFLGLSDQLNNEWLAYSSLRVPILNCYAMEPYYFLSRVEGAARPEHRFMLNNQFRNEKGYELNIGAMYGITGLPREVENDKIFGGYATALFPFSRTVWGQTSLRWERGPFDDLLGLSLGIKLRLEQ